ncbi:DUF998 domain-containing protein [Candidatus Thorarchaeota archaeon]|nr:MAG: DUF998 domain-containing protein [Candidatus Thorarchaeota archaeon]
MSFFKAIKKIPKANLLGFLGPVVSFTAIALAIIIQPGFSWSDNALSDLGSWFRTDLGNYQIVSAILFNGGLIISGICILIFVISLVRQIGDLPSQLSLLVFAGTAILLIGIGTFSEDFHIMHYWTAVPFFLSIPIALGFTGLVWLRFVEIRSLAIVTIILSLGYLILMFQQWIELSIAVFEFLAALFGMGWLWLIDYMHYSGNLSTILTEKDSTL